MVNMDLTLAVVPPKYPMIMWAHLTTNLWHLLKINLVRFDNDATACYDRTIVALGMLDARRCGMPKRAIHTHANKVKFMKYAVKTMYGIFETIYVSGTLFEPLFGTGQGSGASPAVVWLVLIVKTMYGISETNYVFGTPIEPLFGTTGQGSGASPAVVWLMLIVILMNTLDRIIPEHMEFASPDGSKITRRAFSTHSLTTHLLVLPTLANWTSSL
jgi:aconitase B